MFIHSFVSGSKARKTTDKSNDIITHLAYFAKFEILRT